MDEKDEDEVKCGHRRTHQEVVEYPLLETELNVLLDVVFTHGCPLSVT